MGELFDRLVGRLNGSELTLERKVLVMQALQQIDAELESVQTRQDVLAEALTTIRRLMPDLLDDLLRAGPELARLIVVGRNVGGVWT